MQTQYKLVAMAAVLLAVALVSVGCEDSAVVAPAEGQILLTASPSEALVDSDGETARATITIQVLDSGGFLLNGVSVFLFTTGGGFVTARPDAPIETDEGGVATDVLVLTREDPATVTVTAQSSTVSATVDVVNPLGGGNQRPVASIAADPDDLLEDTGNPAQQVGLGVFFDGRASSDPDGDEITCYRWTVTEGNTVLREVFGETESVIDSLTFSEEKSVSVKLEVSDERFFGCTRTDPPPEELNGVPDVLTYLFCDDITEPVAVISVESTVVTIDPMSGEVDVVYDGTLSFDEDTALGDLIFRWDCGEGGQTATGSIATCTYATPGTKTVTLTVEDPPSRVPQCRTRGEQSISIRVNSSEG